MPDLTYEPVMHDRAAFLARARARPGFDAAFAALSLEYQIDAGCLGMHETPRPDKRCGDPGDAG